MNTASVALQPSQRNEHVIAGIILLLWFLIIDILSFNEFFVSPAGEPPLNILLSLATSLLLFTLAYLSMPRVRHYILNLDMRLLIMLHGFRMLGIGFVMLYTVDRLPALFAFVAGFGDAIAAVGAIILAYTLFTSTTQVPGKWIWRWNTFGLVDFIAALSIGILTRSQAPLMSDSGVTSDLMTIFPFAIIPAFLVQVFTITHIIIYLQLRQNTATKS